jgi:Glycosyltransferase
VAQRPDVEEASLAVRAEREFVGRLVLWGPIARRSRTMTAKSVAPGQHAPLWPPADSGRQAIQRSPQGPTRRVPKAARHDRSYAIPKTAYVSTYAPHRCGIATFTYDLATTVGEREIVALHPADEPGPYPAEVRHRIRRDVQADYGSVARALNDCDVDVVSIQHEYGIWGGEDGANVLDFVRALRMPAVATLHTVLRHPTLSQRRILSELIDASTATVVMSRAAASLLTRAYAVEPTRLNIVAHGVPDLPLVAPDTVKPRLGLKGRQVILSFGLLGPGKGYESAIAAMPAVVKAMPSASYVILGATHPDLLHREGEAYRRRLEATAAALGVTDHVQFVDRFVGRVELGRWLEAADVFVTPYPNLDQIVSGTLSYAMGAGKAIVSTPYAYALERLAHGRGRLVPAGSPDALAETFIELLRDPELRASLGRRAYEYSRGMVWSEVGAEYRRVFARAARSAPVPGINANLTAGLDLTRARRLRENLGIAFQGPVKVGPFEIDGPTALKMLASPGGPTAPDEDIAPTTRLSDGSRSDGSGRSGAGHREATRRWD